jgi:hypothetical protein
MTGTSSPDISAAAERMRLHRERRRKGLRCLSIELRESEIVALVRRGLLTAEMQNQPGAIVAALYKFLDRTLNDRTHLSVPGIQPSLIAPRLPAGKR